MSRYEIYSASARKVSDCDWQSGPDLHPVCVEDEAIEADDADDALEQYQLATGVDISHASIIYQATPGADLVCLSTGPCGTTDVLYVFEAGEV